MTIRGYEPGDLAAMREIWNAVVEAGDAFPQTEPLADDAQARTFFGGQTHTAVAADGEGIAGLYILHPNNIGRCGHIANASFAVRPGARGRGMGEALVRDCHGARCGIRVPDSAVQRRRRLEQQRHPPVRTAWIPAARPGRGRIPAAGRYL